MGSDRRYTDQEVALVLHRAAELEERKSRDQVSRGLTVQELEAIARDVGFSPDILKTALADLERGGRFTTRSLLGSSPNSRSVRAVPGRLSVEDVNRLVQLIEDEVPTTGTVSEALGAVRWTTVPNPQGFSPVTQVSIIPGDAETQIQVTRRYATRIRALLHGLPTAWGAMLGVGVAGSASLAVVPAVATILGVAGVGAVIGHQAWQFLSRRNKAKVESLAANLASEAGGPKTER